VQRTKQSTEELRNKLLELQKTKDEGWNELNKQLSQIDQLREVITEQERILEERRVGLIALEAAAKDHRTEKEKVIRELVDVKNNREDLKERLSRADSKIEGLEEEHRRLARMMASQASGGSTGGEDFAKMAAEVRELKIENKKLEQQVARLQADAERTRDQSSRTHDDLASLEVERNQLAEERKSMEQARDRAEERLARAEAAKQRLEEEKQQIAQARDTALSSANDVRHLHDRALRRIADLEKELGDGGAGSLAAAQEAKKIAVERDALKGTVARAEARVKELEAERVQITADLAKARAGGVSATSEDVTPPDGTKLPEHVAAAGGEALRAKAQEVYDGINEALSSLRTTILTAKGLFGEVSPMVSDEDARKALGEAIAESMARTEDAKGTLRSLRELLQS
jgi:chromosome segregation ATPase